MVSYPMHERTILKYAEEIDAKHFPSNIFVSALPISIQIKRTDTEVYHTLPGS